MAVIPVFVLIPPRTLLLDVAGPVEILRRANLEQDRIRFEMHYVGPSASITSSIGLRLSGIEPLPAELPADAMIVISGSVDAVMNGPGETAEDRAQDALLVEWLSARVTPTHKLVSICSGALLAARAGLLDGHACTTHHTSCGELAALAPNARVLENRLFVEDGERLSSAGVTAGIDLMLHLVSRLVDPPCAVAVARHLVVYLRRAGADPQLSPWLEGRNHVHPAIHRVQDAIAAAPAENWTLETLAGFAGASGRHLSRLFNAHAGMGVTDYINRLRIAHAQALLAHTRLDMEHVAERAGFASSRHLRRVWRRFHETPPKAARPQVS